MEASLKIVEVEGAIFTPDNLPEVPVRWTARHKAHVAACIIGQVLTYDQAKVRYSASKEELVGWMKKFGIGDVGALRIRSIQRLPRDVREPALR